MPTVRLQRQHTAVLIVDVQEKLLAHMHAHQTLLTQVEILAKGADLLNVPLLVTEQYPQGLGKTVPSLANAISKAKCRCDKHQFSAYTQTVRRTLNRHHIRSVVVCGIESHVCVLQTCLDLADAGFLTAVATDAIGSRREIDQETAIKRLIQAGIVPTTVESALLEWVREAGGEHFKAILPIIR